MPGGPEVPFFRGVLLPGDRHAFRDHRRLRAEDGLSLRWRRTGHASPRTEGAAVTGEHYQDEELLAFDDGSDTIDIAAVTAHLAACQDCRGNLASLRSLTAMLG